MYRCMHLCVSEPSLENVCLVVLRWEVGDAFRRRFGGFDAKVVHRGRLSELVVKAQPLPPFKPSVDVRSILLEGKRL